MNLFLLADAAPHPFGWLSLVPPLVAIALAIATRRILLSLLIGIVVGAITLQHGNPIAGIQSACIDFLWEKLIDYEKVQVYTFTLLMGGMIGLISASGGMRGLVNLLVRFANTRLKGQITGWLMGLVIFFDDYANMLLLGGTLKPLTDRLKISREKLAYIVDSTAAPVAGLALISTWVATEINFIQQGIQQAEATNLPDAFVLFIQSIPYRFYTLWALLLVPLVALTRRDFGPMLKAEVRMLSPDKEATQKENGQEADSQELPLTSSWLNAAVPVGVMLVVILSVLYWTGYQVVIASNANPSLLQIFGKGESYLALVVGSATGLVLSIGLILPQKLLSNKEAIWAILKGFYAMAPALLILWLAAALAAQTGKPKVNAKTEQIVVNGLDTAGYMESILRDNLSATMLPTTIFLISAAVAFATGTSWGTMGILIPPSVSLTANMLTAEGQPLDVGDPILLAAVGSVLSGAIFGDHCSPISDTTILSSQSCGCNHIDHVRTQMPYALLGAVASVLAGTIPIAYGAPIWFCHVMGVGMLLGTLYLVGKVPEELVEQASDQEREDELEAEALASSSEI